MLVLACCAVGTLLRVFGVANGVFALLVGMTPFIGLTYAVPLVLGGVAHSRVLVGFSALGLIVHAIWLAPLFVADGPKPEHGRKLVVLSSNIWNGAGDADAIVALIRRHRVDVLAVQELTTDSLDRLNAAGVTRLLPHHYTAPAASTGIGTGIWSRYPLSARAAVRGTTFRNLLVTLDADGGKIRLLVAHPAPPIDSAGYRHWRRDYQALRAIMAGPAAPVAAVGDFNATLDHRQLRELLGNRYVDAADRSGSGPVLTWPATGWPPTMLALDHVLVQPDVGVESFTRHHVPRSDHYAVLAVLRLLPAAVSWSEIPNTDARSR